MPIGSGSWKPAWSDDGASVVDPLVLESIGRRMRYVNMVAPDAAQDPGAIAGITELAKQPTSDQEFQRNINEMYGFNDAGKIAADLMGSPKDIALIKYQQLPKEMRVAVKRQGFVPEKYGTLEEGDDKPSGLFGSLPGVGGIAQAVTGFIGEDIIHPAAEGMNLLGRASTHAYRTSVDVGQDGSGFFGGLFSPDAWSESWGDTGNGNTYMLDDDRDQVKKDYELDDEQLDLYLNLSQGKLPGEIAEEEGYAIGSPEHIARVQFLYDQMATPTGKELIGDPLNGMDGMLNNYRVSFGRIWTRRMGFSPGSLDNGFGRVISGAGDLTWALTADPTLALGKAFKGVKIGQTIIEALQDTEKVADAVKMARMLRYGEATKHLEMGVPGIRNVVVKDAAGGTIGRLAESRLRVADRNLNFVEMVNKAFVDNETPETLAAQAKLFEALPGIHGSFQDLWEISTRMAVDEGKTGGLADFDNFMEWFQSEDGLRMVRSAKFGGKNTAKHIVMPEIGRSTRLKMEAKGLLHKSQAWHIDMDRRLAEQMGVAPGRMGAVARGLLPIRYEIHPVLKESGEALLDAAGKPVTKTNLAPSINPLRTVGRAALGINPLGGKFTKIFTTHVMRGGAISHWGGEAIDEFDRYLDMGSIMGMPQYKIDAYKAKFLGTSLRNSDDEIIRGAIGQSAANRASVIRAYEDDLLSMFDIPEESDLFRFLNRADDQVFNLLPDGSARPGGAMMLSQTAQATAVPSMRDMLMATNRYSVMRSLFGRGGILNPKLIDTALTRYWKPSVLMRVGFIGRAAGEELLGLLARFGSAKYLGVTLGQDVAKKRVYDELLQDIPGHNPTIEMIRDWRTRGPDMMDDMLEWTAQRDMPHPDAREILSWGQSQALAPMTGAIHTMDNFAQHVLLAPYAGDLAHAPQWKVRAADRIRRADNRALHMSLRTARRFERAGVVTGNTVRAVPGLMKSADALDAVLSPIIQRYALDWRTFREVLEQPGMVSKDQAARLFANLDDDDYAQLENMLTDPVIRKAQLEHVTSGDMYNLRLEPGQARPSTDVRMVEEVDNKGNRVMKPMVPESNIHTRILRDEGHGSTDYFLRLQDRWTHLLDDRTKLGEVAVDVLSQYVSPQSLHEIATAARTIDHPLVTGIADDHTAVQALLTEVQHLPREEIEVLRDAVRNGTTPGLARDMADAITGTSVRDIYHRRTLETLGSMPISLHEIILNPKLSGQRMHSDFAALETELYDVTRGRFGTPAVQRVANGWEGLHEGMTEGLRANYTRINGIGTSAPTADWARVELTERVNPEMKVQFQERMSEALRERHRPDISQEIADELFADDYPAAALLDTYKANGRNDSIPISMMVSPDTDITDMIVDTLSEVTGKTDFHVITSDVPNARFSSRAQGTGTMLLDDTLDWQESKLFRVQMGDFSNSKKMARGSKVHLVEAPPNPALHPEYGPPSPLRGEATVGPQNATWQWTGDPYDINIEDVVDQLPRADKGKVNVFGTRPKGSDGPIVWQEDDTLDGVAHEAKDWFYAEVDEGTSLDDLEDVEAHHFATEEEVPLGPPDEAGNIETGFRAKPREFERTVMAPEESWNPGYSPLPFAQEHEQRLRRIANLDRTPFEPEELDDEMRTVIERLGFNPDTISGEGRDMRMLRRQLANQADNFLIEARQGAALPTKQWWDKDALDGVAQQMGGEWTPNDISAIHNEALYQATKINPPTEPLTPAEIFLFSNGGTGAAVNHGFASTLRAAGVPSGMRMIDDAGEATDEFAEFATDIEYYLDQNIDFWENTGYNPNFPDSASRASQADEALEDLHIARSALTKLLGGNEETKAVRQRLMRSRDTGLGTVDTVLSSGEVISPVAVRNAAVADLDALVPGWRGSEGWDRVGTGRIFGIDSHEPTALEGGARKIYSSGLSPDQKNDEIVKAHVEEVIRHMTSARSGSGSDPRVLNEIIFHLGRNPSKRNVDLDLLHRPPIKDMPAATYGQKYITKKDYAWDRMTNWFFDDVAAKGIASIVRNQLFAINYLDAAKGNRYIYQMLKADPQLEAEMEAILPKLGPNVTMEHMREYLRQKRHGMLPLPHHIVDPWDEVIDVNGVETTISHQNILEMNSEGRREAITAVQNDPVAVPEPEMSIAQANKLLRSSMDIEDTPRLQAVREAQAETRDAIWQHKRKVYKDSMARTGGDRETAKRAVRKWEDENMEVWNERLEADKLRGEESVRRARAAGEQLGSDPTDMAGFVPGKAEGRVPEVNELMAMEKADPEGFYAKMHQGNLQHRSKLMHNKRWEELDDNQKRAVLRKERQRFSPTPGKMATLPDDDEFIADLSGPELDTLRHWFNTETNALNAERDANISRALEGVVPFIDDHRVRSQFQEYVGNLVPFFFAEEQFYKRWARIFKESPEAFRKGQLAMHGLRVTGAIQTDMNGNTYYVYPGSAAATEIFAKTPVAKLLFGSMASQPVGLSLTGDVNNTLPGFGDQLGTPSAGPIVGLGLEMLASRSPEWAKVQTAVMGERGSNRDLLSFVVPTTVSRFYDAIIGKTDEVALSSALVQTAQLMEASGHGLPEDATPDQEQEYLDKVESNARSILMIRALFGVVTPASPGSNVSTELPLADEFKMLTNSGIPYTEALRMFMEHNKGDVSPYTVFKTDVPSGAPIAASEAGLRAMDEYGYQLREFPMAGPWMLLPLQEPDSHKNGNDELTSRAYRQAMRQGVRKHRNLKEYVHALAWADASPEYFDTVEMYDAQIASADEAEDEGLSRALTEQKFAFTDAFKNAHPVFADKLMSSQGRTERQQILRESMLLIQHPGVQSLPNMPQMKEMLNRYQEYKDALEGLNKSRARPVVERKLMLTQQFQGWLGIHLIENPGLRYFYDRVLRPELSWDKSTLDEGLVA